MRRRTLALMCVLAACSPTVETGDGAPDGGDGGGDGGGDADGDTDGDGDGDGDADGDGGFVLPDMTWSQRACEVTLTHRAGTEASEVLLAGSFTDWGGAPVPMTDEDGDGTYSITLGPEDGLEPGEIYPYKFVVDGEWRLDMGSTYRRYDGDCVNSAFMVPACTAGPEIAVEGASVSYDEASASGAASVRLVLHSAADGAPLASAALSLDGEGLGADAISPDADAGALDVALSGLELGRHVLAVRATDSEGRQASPVDLPLWVEEEPFDWRDAVMYMLVIDRFANGETASDAPYGAPVLPPADWHGGDLWGVLEALRGGYFQDLGVNVLWLSPVNQQAEGAFPGRDDSNMYTSYHGYWPSRARAVDPHYGGGEALRELVDEAHRQGIRVLLDLINNQVHEQHEAYVAHPDWFRVTCICGIDPGCDWSERPLDCLFAPYLPDIDWRQQGAEHQFVDDALYWLDEYGVDGFRVDAVKHVETNSIYNLRAAIAERFERGGARLLLEGETAVTAGDSVDYGCGETYGNGYEWVDAYVGETALDGQFDFPFHHRVQEGLLTGSLGFVDLESAIAESEARYDRNRLMVFFLGTHDSSRMASRAAVDPARDCHWAGGGACATMPTLPTDPFVYQRLRRAFTVLMTLPMIPLIYYGDEVATPGGGDPDSRHPMVWTGELSHLSMAGTELSPLQGDLQRWVGSLGTARAASLALRRGARVPLLVEPDLYVYAYHHAASGEVAVVVLNRGAAVTGRAVRGLPAEVLAGASFEAVVGSAEAVPRGDVLEVSIPAGEAAVFLAR